MSDKNRDRKGAGTLSKDLMLNRLSFLIALLLTSLSILAGDAPNPQVEADKKALGPIVQYVGGWRGVGLPKDGSKDGWSEEAEWLFDLKGGHAAIVFNADKGKYYKTGRIEPAGNGAYKFVGTLPDGKTKEEMTGEIAKADDSIGGISKGDLVFKNPGAAEGRPARLIMGLVAKGNRLVINLQKKMAGERFANMSELGYTRKGSGFGKQTDAHECIITGGTGTITVSYKGQTYWVCCTGCRDAFNENPEKELAAYKKRKEEEKRKDMQ